jgi:hypothetical protein
MEVIDDLIARMRVADSEEDRTAIKAALESYIRNEGGVEARIALEKAARDEVLEIRWELEDVIDQVSPPPPPAPKVPIEPEKPAPPPKTAKSERAPPAGAPIPNEEPILVYDDPRGLLIHRTRDSAHWYATQVDPRSGEPQTFELVPGEVSALKQQLAGSPYWVLGADGDE